MHLILVFLFVCGAINFVIECTYINNFNNNIKIYSSFIMEYKGRSKMFFQSLNFRRCKIYWILYYWIYYWFKIKQKSNKTRCKNVIFDTLTKNHENNPVYLRKVYKFPERNNLEFPYFSLKVLPFPSLFFKLKFNVWTKFITRF